jgi:hypothetical protein
MDLTESLVQMEPLNIMEMFKPSVRCNRIQPTGKTGIHANDFGTPCPQGFTKTMDSNENKMMKNYIWSSGTTESMSSNSEYLHEGSKVIVQNIGSAKPARNVIHPAFTDKTYMYNVTDNVQNFGLIISDRETCMNKMVDSSTRCTDVSDMKLKDELKQKESDTAKASSQITDVADMELTWNVNHKNIHIPFRNSAHNSYMEITNGVRKKQITDPVEVSSTAADVDEMEFTSERQNQTSSLVEKPGLICNATDMELTSGTTWKEICNPGDVNRHINDMKLINENRQEHTSGPAVVSSQVGNVTDMELTSGIKWKEMCNPDVNRCMNEMRLRSERREEQVSAKSKSVSNWELRNELRQKKIFNQSRVTDLCKDVTDMELSEVNQEAICNQLLEVSKCDSHAKNKNISATETWKERPKVSFTHTSNNDCIKLSKQDEMGDIADVSHSLKSCNFKPVSDVKELNSNGSEEVARHSAPTACISVSGERRRQLDHVEAETALKQVSSSKQTTVQTLGKTEKCEAKDNSVTLFKPTDGTNCLPVSKITDPNTDGRYSERRSVLHAERINVSENCSNIELNVECHVSSKNSVPAVSFNLSIPLNAKGLRKRSHKCDMKLLQEPRLDHESVNESIQNTTDESSLLHGRHGSENSNTSSDKVSQSHTSRTDNRVVKENLSMQPLMEPRTYICCTTGTDKKLSLEYDTAGNAASHSNQQFQYATKGVREKTCTQENSTENTQMPKSNKRNSIILEEELDGKQGHTTKQLALNEYHESSDLHVRMTTLPEPQDNQIVEHVNTGTLMDSIESGVMKENLNCSQLESTLASMPHEMELSIIKDLSHETNESYNKLVDNVREADEIISKTMFMTLDDSAMLDNNQSTQQNSEEGTSLLLKLSNMENTINESVTMKEESTKHLELKTVTRQQKSNLDEKFKSSIKQTDEQMKPKQPRINENDDVAVSSLEEQMKAAELRLVIAMQ